jgi:haloalkane dehalogenase
MSLYYTPDERFDDVPDFPYEPTYVDVGGPEMAYVEAGDGPETFLCLHGEPSWSFLYRKMIPVLAERGRVIAPDFVGFGRSAKYEEPSEYSFRGFYDQLRAFIEGLDLQNVTVVGQDWGGLLGLTVAGHYPERFARLVPMNTGVLDGSQKMPEEWLEFRDFVEHADDIDVGRMVQSGCASDLDDNVLDAYRAPFPIPSSKAGVRAWPLLVPTAPDNEGAALVRDASERLAEWRKPAFVLFGDSDPITRRYRSQLRDRIPTAADQPDMWIEGAGHFLQEDRGEAVAERIVDFVDRTPPE